jgi:Zn-dependent peptidase ImmA (M78 family)
MSNQTLIERNIEIKKKLNDKKNPIENLAVFAKGYGISRNRLYQIKKSRETFCKKHSIYFYSKCMFCRKESTKKNRASEIKELLKKNPGLVEKIQQASRHDRTVAAVEHRKQTVNVLIQEFGLNSTEVGKLIKRSHSTILALHK